MKTDKTKEAAIEIIHKIVMGLEAMSLSDAVSFLFTQADKGEGLG